MTSYRAFQKLQEIHSADGEAGHGIRLRVANFFFDKPIESNQEEYEKMMEIKEAQVRLILPILRGTH
jgi:D-amino-acid oxidase